MSVPLVRSESVETAVCGETEPEPAGLLEALAGARGAGDQTAAAEDLRRLFAQTTIRNPYTTSRLSDGDVFMADALEGGPEFLPAWYTEAAAALVRLAGELAAPREARLAALQALRRLSRSRFAVLLFDELLSLWEARLEALHACLAAEPWDAELLGVAMEYAGELLVHRRVPAAARPAWVTVLGRLLRKMNREPGLAFAVPREHVTRTLPFRCPSAACSGCDQRVQLIGWLLGHHSIGLADAGPELVREGGWVLTEVADYLCAEYGRPGPAFWAVEPLNRSKDPDSRAMLNSVASGTSLSSFLAQLPREEELWTAFLVGGGGRGLVGCLRQRLRWIHAGPGRFHHRDGLTYYVGWVADALGRLLEPSWGGLSPVGLGLRVRLLRAEGLGELLPDLALLAQEEAVEDETKTAFRTLDRLFRAALDEDSARPVSNLPAFIRFPE